MIRTLEPRLRALAVTPFAHGYGDSDELLDPGPERRRRRGCPLGALDSVGPVGSRRRSRGAQVASPRGRERLGRQRGYASPAALQSGRRGRRKSRRHPFLRKASSASSDAGEPHRSRNPIDAPTTSSGGSCGADRRRSGSPRSESGALGDATATATAAFLCLWTAATASAAHLGEAATATAASLL